MKSVALVLALALPASAAAAAEPPRFGVIASTQGPTWDDDAKTFIQLYEKQRAFHGAPIGIRLFGQGEPDLPGDRGMVGKLLTWAAEHHPEEHITVSHRIRNERRLARFADWVRRRKLRATVIFFHEAQEGWFARPVRLRDPQAERAAYRATYRKYREVLGARSGNRVRLEKNLMWFWQHYRARRDGGDWRGYVEHDDPADLLSWDTYAFPGMPAELRRYATPDEFFRYARDAWRDFSLPWAVGEIGSSVPAWDREGRIFAAWVPRIAAAAADPSSIGPAYAGMPPALFLKWWAAPDKAGRDQSLEQVPQAARTWRDLVRSAPL